MQVNYITGVCDLFETLESAAIWHNGCRYLWVMFEAQDHYKLNTVCCCGSLNGPPELLQACYTLCGSQNGLSEPLQVSNMLCSSQNEFSELLQCSDTLCGCQNGLSKPPDKSPTCFAVIKTDSPNLHKPLTRFAVVIGPTLVPRFDHFLMQKKGSRYECRKDPQAQCSSSAVSPLPGFCSLVL